MTTAVQLAQSVAPGVSLGFKNRIINGGMTIDQRNAGASVTLSTAGSSYITDRFAAFQNNPSATVTAQQSTNAPAGYVNSLLITAVTGASSGSVYRAQVFQHIEGYNIADLNWGTASAATVTLSFWVKSSKTGQFGGAIQNGAGTRSYPFTYTINVAGTWEYKTITVPGDTTGTWATNNASGILLQFDLGMGTTLLGTPNTWAAADYRGATGDTSIVATTGATWQITGVQLEVGTAATSFEFRDYGRELMLCQRYYTIFNGGSDNYAGFGMATATAGTNLETAGTLPVMMRATPTVNFSTLRVTGSNSASLTSILVTRNTQQTYYVVFASSGLNTGYSYLVQKNNSATAYMDFSAEL